MFSEPFLDENYTFTQKLGVGGFGSAYIAKSKQTNELVVIKEVDLSGLEEKPRKLMEQEGFILQKLSHPNIVKCLDSKIINEKAYIVMEYADDGDLKLKIKEHKQKNIPFKEENILNWFIEICDAINYIHSQKIIHRDLKPNNIFLMKNNHIKLGGFDFAIVLYGNETSTDTLLGNQRYLSPEIIKRETYDYRTNIWDLGIILYGMINFKYPFEAKSMHSMYMKIVNGKIGKIEQKNISNELIELIHKILQVNPLQRPQIKEIINKCRNILEKIKKENKEKENKENDEEKKENNNMKNNQYDYGKYNGEIVDNKRKGYGEYYNKNEDTHNVNTYDTSIEIDKNIFSFHIEYKINNIMISIEEKNEIPPKKYEKLYSKKDFENINKFFRMFDDNLEIFNKLIELFDKKKFLLDIKEEEIILKIKNEIVEFHLSIPLIENNNINELLKNLCNIIKDLKNDIKELKEENNNLKEKIKDLENKNIKYEEEIKQLKIKIEEKNNNNNNYILSSDLINKEEINLISNWIKPNSKIIFKLLYKASIDGDLMSTFHSKCDNKGPTLIIIKSSKGKRFGGYNPLSWDTTEKWKTDPHTFIFSLDTKKKYIIIKENMKRYSSVGASEYIGFGYYCSDLLIRDQCMSRNDNRTNGKESAYNITKQYEFTGEENFTIDDYECYSVSF